MNDKNFFKSRKFYAILIISVIIVSDLIFSTLFYYSKANNSNSNFVEILYFFSQIISSIFVISGVIIALWQYYITFRSNQTNINIIQTQRAIDLSEYYKDNILKNVQVIFYIFGRTGIDKILCNIAPKDMVNFDEQEFNRLLSKTQREELKRIESSDLFMQAVMEANQIYNLGLSPLNITTVSEGNNKFPNFQYSKETVRTFAAKIFDDALNNAEFFAMHFSHGTADDSVVYQSLHQTYLILIEKLYFRITRINDGSTDQYYTNVIWLYKKWYKRKCDSENIMSSHKHTLTKPESIIDK